LAADGSSSVVSDLGMSGVMSGGRLVLATGAGSITALDAVTAAGNMLLQSGGADSDLLLAAALRSDAGSISLNAGRDIAQDGAIATLGAGATIELLAARDITMSANSVTASNAGNLRYAAGGNLTLGLLDARSAADRASGSTAGQAGWGSVSLLAGGAIADTAAGIDVMANALRINAGAAGSLTNALETEIALLSAHLGAGGLFITEAGALATGTGAIALNRVAVDGNSAVASDAAQYDLLAGGDIALDTINGAITLNDGNADGIAAVAGGKLTVFAGAGALAINGTVQSGAAMSLDANGGALTMLGGASALAGTATLAVHAATDATLGNLVGGAVSVRADAGSILNAAGSTLNVSAVRLDLVAGGGIGSGARHLTSTVGILGATGANGIYLTESDVLVVERLVAINGQLVLETVNGSITLNAGADVVAGQDVLLAANGANADLVLAANLVSGAGSISLRAGHDLVQNANVTTLAAGRSIDLLAGRLIGMAEGVAVSSVNGAIVLTAGGDVTIETLSAGSGNVGITAGGSVLDQDGAGDTGVDILAGGLRVNAGMSIGTAANRLELSVSTLSAHAGGAVFLTETDGLTVGALDVAANRIDGAGQRTTFASGVQSGLASGANGSVVLISNSGDLTLAATGGSVLADGSGNILLQASAGNITLGSALSTAGGNITVSAAGAITQTSNVSAGGSAELVALGGITMSDGSVTRGANLRLAAGGNISVGLLDAGGGNVSLTAGGMITDAQPAGAAQTVNVAAAGLRMAAGSGIGAVGKLNALETMVATLAARTASGDISVRDSDSLEIAAGGVTASEQSVLADGGTVQVTDALLAGLSAPAGDIDLTSVTGGVLFGRPVTASPGGDLSVVGDTFVITQPIEGNGGELLIMPSDPARNIVIGGPATGGVLQLDQNALNNLTGGFGQIVIGGGAAAPGQDITIDGSGTPVLFNDALVLNVSGPGSVISITGSVGAEGLLAQGAVTVTGAVTIAAGNGAGVAGGDIVFAQSVDAGGANASLTLAAGGDSVVFGGAIGATGALAGLSIGNAANVTFSEPVTVNGNIEIEATGVVRFDSALTIDSGSLVIKGASAVIIGDVVLQGTAGVFVIEANTLTLNGDVLGAKDVLLRPTDIGLDITIGGSGASGAYNISVAMLQRLVGMEHLVVGVRGADGHAALGAGDVSIAPLNLGAFSAATLEVYGGLVTLSVGAGELAVRSGIVLDGREGVVLHDSVRTSGGGIVLNSATGAIGMDGGATLSAPGTVRIEAAGNLAIGLVQADSVLLRSTGGTIADAATDGAVNITANTVSIYGYGPRVGLGDALEVNAPTVFVQAPTGIVLQDTGADGRTHFYVLDGATMYEQAIG
ncbi:beta strand repeat-containing protein, partial [Massilia glaciei]